jgi:predicted nuclease of predicted toxin-antitoxin system
MRILADENCDRLLVAMLRDAGHDVVYVAEMASGESDAEVIRRAHVESRVILTDDRDFGLLAERESDQPPTIVLLRLDPLSRTARVRRAVEVLNSLGDTLRQELVVVEPAQVRRRPYRR